MGEIEKKSTEKELKSYLSKLTGELEALKIESTNKKREVREKIDVIKSVSDRIEKLKSKKALQVSEHAILRYLSRVKNIDIEEIKKEILSEDIIKMQETLGSSGQFPNKNGYGVVFKDGVVTTIIVDGKE